MKRSRRLAWIVGAILGLAVLAGIQLARWHRNASRTFERHAADLRAREASSPERIIRRAALFEPVQQGDAWQCYAPILPALRSFSGNWTWPAPPAEEHDRLLAACQPTLLGLRQAFSRELLTFPPARDVDPEDPYVLTRSLLGASAILIRVAEGHHARKQDPEALEILLLQLGVASDLTQIQGVGISPIRWGHGEESRAFGSWRRFLEGHALSSAEIVRAVAQAERVRSSRSSIHRHVAALGIQWRENMLDWEREGMRDFPYGELPSWHYAFSARLGRATALGQIESLWKRLEELERLPSSQWLPTLATLSKKHGSEAIAKPFEDVEDAFEGELETLRAWNSVRVAMAIARFEVEQGRYPALLEELLPRYLEAVPDCPQGGEPLQYKAGEVWCRCSASWWKVARGK